MVSSSYLKETCKQPEKLTAYVKKVIIYYINSYGCFRMQLNTKVELSIFLTKTY